MVNYDMSISVNKFKRLEGKEIHFVPHDYGCCVPVTPLINVTISIYRSCFGLRYDLLFWFKIVGVHIIKGPLVWILKESPDLPTGLGPIPKRKTSTPV